MHERFKKVFFYRSFLHRIRTYIIINSRIQIKKRSGFAKLLTFKLFSVSEKKSFPMCTVRKSHAHQNFQCQLVISIADFIYTVHKGQQQ